MNILLRVVGSTSGETLRREREREPLERASTVLPRPCAAQVVLARPPLNAYGADLMRFSYYAVDGVTNESSAVATVVVSVDAVNDPPMPRANARPRACVRDVSSRGLAGPPKERERSERPPLPVGVLPRRRGRVDDALAVWLGRRRRLRCDRDREGRRDGGQRHAGRGPGGPDGRLRVRPVSYTHLTLPTKA